MLKGKQKQAVLHANMPLVATPGNLGTFSCFHTQATETTTAENLLLILALTAHAVTISFIRAACRSLPLALFRVVLSDQHGLWATGDDKL